MRRLPDVVTHNYHRDRGRFRNICALPAAEAEAILDAIRAAGRRIKPDYLRRRIATEQWLRRERLRKLGQPALPYPIYFFLGDFADGLDPSRPHSIQVPLAIFPRAAITFTYTDSMTGLPPDACDPRSDDRGPHVGHVFTLDEIREVVAQVGMPGMGGNDGASAFPRPFIEMQLWDDRPLRDFLAQATGADSRFSNITLPSPGA